MHDPQTRNRVQQKRAQRTVNLEDLEWLDWLTQAAVSKVEKLEAGQSHIFVSGPGETTTATRLPSGELECQLNPTPERPGLNMDHIFG